MVSRGEIVLRHTQGILRQVSVMSGVPHRSATDPHSKTLQTHMNTLSPNEEFLERLILLYLHGCYRSRGSRSHTIGPCVHAWSGTILFGREHEREHHCLETWVLQYDSCVFLVFCERQRIILL